MLSPSLEEKLADQPYVNGFLPSSADFELWGRVRQEGISTLGPNTKRWFKHISSFSDCEQKSFQTSMAPQTNSPVSTEQLENLPQYLLDLLERDGNGFNTVNLASSLDVDHQKVIGAVKSLLAQEGVISTKDVVLKRIELSAEGKDMAENGSYEYRVFLAVGDDGALQADISKQPFGKVGVNKALAAGWISVDKSGGAVRIVRKVPDGVIDTVAAQLKDLKMEKPVDDKAKNELKKRKLISEITVKALEVTKGPCFTTELIKPEADLTQEMINSGSWKTKAFKKYNFDAKGIQPPCGHLHPLMKVRAEFRQIFFSMGFSEMPTNRYVESSFWNFDALFQPQQHPARDSHDTFFISDPAISTQFPQEYLERVRTVHSKGGYGSIGYNYDWKIEEAQKNVLRTHTTAVSARVLYELAQQKEFKPAKMFSIDRVFRNETLDATHLAEFHQVEGVIAERNLSLAHLIGIFTEFFKKLGIENLRFKPTYNPYTEPSMEIFAYHEGLKKWVEIGNSGMFRPEMLLPMGLPPDVNVAGYGLSLERPTMIRYGIDNIRDMFGPKINLEMIYNGPICRLDKK